MLVQEKRADGMWDAAMAALKYTRVKRGYSSGRKFFHPRPEIRTRATVKLNYSLSLQNGRKFLLTDP